MSAFFNPDEHIGDIQEAALRLAPICTNGVDFSNQGGEGRFGHQGKSDSQIVAERAWQLGEAFVEQYYRKIEEAGVREQEAKALAERNAAKKHEVAHA
jgi:hypothetical protein